MRKAVIFTDLDGTLLDHSTYSFDPALPALKALKERNIPLVICSSKTRAEIEYYRDKLDNVHPFVSENGGGIFIPKNYFRFSAAAEGFPPRAESRSDSLREEDNYLVIRLGTRYHDLRKAIASLRGEGFKIRGFGDMTVEEVAGLANMTPREAEMAKERDFDEPFIFDGNESEVPGLLDAIEAKGLSFTQGRFFHLLGGSDKGRAVAVLSELYRKEYGEILTVALGDSPNDIPMLEKVDYPLLVQNPAGQYNRVNVANLIRTEGIGPEGWNKAVLSLMRQGPLRAAIP